MKLSPDVLIVLLGLGPRLFSVKIFVDPIGERHRRADSLSILAAVPRGADLGGHFLGIEYPDEIRRARVQLADASVAAAPDVNARMRVMDGYKAVVRSLGRAIEESEEATR